MDEITELWENFTLTKEKEETIIIDSEKPLMTPENVQLYAVGKLHTSKRISVEAFRSVMKSLWKVHESTHIETAGMNLYVIVFKSMAEKNRVLTSGPWSFEKSLLVLTSPTATDQPRDMNFNFFALWIQIHCIPFQCMIKDMAKFLGTRIGEVEEIDCNGSYEWTGPFIRVRVQIDISKPF